MPRPKFQKGNKLGKGRPKLPQELKDFRAHFDPKVWEAISKFLEQPKEEIKLLLKDNKLTGLEWIAARIVSQADIDTLVKLHLIPKPKDEVVFSGNNVQVMVGVPLNGSEKKES